MIDKLIIDGENIELSEKDTFPYQYKFSTAKTHTVKYALSDTNEIAAGAFKDCKNMTKVTFPPEITMIKREAFRNCSKLDNVIIPTTIEYIGPKVWDGCTSLNTLTFEATVPPTNYATLPDNCTVFIPNDSKYVEAEGTLDPDNVIYYSKTEYNMYEEVEARNIDNSKTYYYDNWTSIGDNDRTVELKNKKPIESIDFEQSTINTSIANGDSIVDLNYTITPSDATNTALYFFHSGSGNAEYYDEDPNTVYKDFLKDGKGTIQVRVTSAGNAESFTIYAESGANAKCSVKGIK
jgi:hypothetical protein